MEFIKYQSLGNDCILIDRFQNEKTSLEISPAMVTHICDRNFGVGADGVILITKDPETKLPSIHICNSDGTKAETCFNGLRCVADYLFQTYKLPSTFHVQIGTRTTTCTVLENAECRRIRTNVGRVTYLGKKELVTSQGLFNAHIASVGNPHCIFFQKQTFAWLQSYGHEIESHPLFPDKTNVEFVTPVLEEAQPTYDLLVYERGCGMTLACGSGAAAVVGVLATLGKISSEQNVSIQMPGGTLSACINQQGSVVLEAAATYVFKGFMNGILAP